MRSVKWVSPWFRANCPFCFRDFHPADAPFRDLRSDDLKGDEQVRKYLRLDSPPEMAPVYDPPRAGTAIGRLWQRVRLDNRWPDGHERVCPHCHLPLPLSVAGGELGGEPIAVLGEQLAGKSTYFGALIHQLRHGSAGRDVGLSVIAQDTFDTEQMQRVSSQKVYDRVYGRMFAAEATMPEPTRGAAVAGVTPPLIYRLQFADRPWWTGLLRRRARALETVFFDPGGGDLVDGEAMELYHRYLSRVRGVILLIDPINLPDVRDRVSDEVRPHLHPPRVSQATDVVESLIKLFERFGGLGSADQIGVPIAVVLAKSDWLRPIAPAVFYKPAHHVEEYDREGADELSRAAERWLEEQGQHNLVELLTRFARRTYCAVSALGTAAEPGGQVRHTRNTHRVTDPLFAVLHHLGYLRARAVP